MAKGKGGKGIDLALVFGPMGSPKGRNRPKMSPMEDEDDEGLEEPEEPEEGEFEAAIGEVFPDLGEEKIATLKRAFLALNES